jgi:hypothetical protein
MPKSKEPPGFNSALIHSFRFKAPIDFASRLIIKNAFRMLGQKLFEGKYAKVQHRDKLKAGAAHPIRFHVTKTHVHCAYYYNAKVIDRAAYHGELETTFSKPAENCIDAFRKNLPLWLIYLRSSSWFSTDIHENMASTFGQFVSHYDQYLAAPHEDYTYEPERKPPKPASKKPEMRKWDDVYKFRANATRHVFEVPFMLKELMDPNNCHMISIFGVIFDENWKWYDNDFQFLIDWQEYIPYFAQLQYERILVVPLTGDTHGSITLHIPQPYHDFFQRTSVLGRFVLSENQLRSFRDGEAAQSDSHSSDSW